MSNAKRIHGIERAGAGDVGPITTGASFGPCPSCGAELHVTMAMNPATNKSERALIHTVPFCTYFGETDPEQIERDVEGNKIMTDEARAQWSEMLSAARAGHPTAIAWVWWRCFGGFWKWLGDVARPRDVDCSCYGCSIRRQRAGLPGPDRRHEACDPPEACATHGHCWTHSAWSEE